ncbi:hypothetical protein SAMN05660772_02106 [Pasteurella testudinis DSM 23072]|uniref:DUF2570 domain-containing protein n=1 Tax=Pasteurella testudinis DSM 23072 TaxID=1122938 RepID=A0A1W1UMS7_9PAST|nr:hypothetical protein [Pasteurella testudinis]SMB82435.1 hypothetical protein SAMN05660772_02106 [Pasteurella testudinis DSM 23072]SUB52208.1 phage lysis regulatory protein, LysB family [Pasteurella testudinis]
MFGITLRDGLIYALLISIVIGASAVGHYQRKTELLTEQNRTLQRENQLLTAQQQQQAQRLQQYQQQRDQLNHALQQQQQQADSRNQQLTEALEHEQNQDWRNQPVPDNIKRLFNHRL